MSASGELKAAPIEDSWDSLQCTDAWATDLNRYPLNDVPGHSLFPAMVKLCRPWIGAPGGSGFLWREVE
jgi:hypothetical protein